MASTGPLADLAKKPPLVRAGVLALGLLVIAGIYYQLVYSGLAKDIEAQEQSAQALIADEQKLRKEEKEYAELQQRQEELEAMIKANDSALPTAAQLPAFFDMLSRKVGESSVEVRRWVPQKEEFVEESIYKVPVEIEIQGTFYELKRFFYLLYKMNQSERDLADDAEDAGAVEERDRIVTIEELQIGDPVVKNNELLLTATFRASTFRKDEPDPPPAEADPKGKPGDKKAAPPPKGQTGTPQQLKQKTDGALDKSEQRVEKAPGTVEATGADRVKGGM